MSEIASERKDIRVGHRAKALLSKRSAYHSACLRMLLVSENLHAENLAGEIE